MRFDRHAMLALGLAVDLLLVAGTVRGIVTRLTSLRDVLAAEQFIFVVKIEKLEHDRPAATFRVIEDLKGKAPFRSLEVP